MGALSRIVPDGAGNQHFIPIPPRRKKEGADKDCSFSLRKFLRSWAHLSFLFQEFMCQEKNGSSVPVGEEENRYWGTIGRVQREGLVHTEFEVTRGHAVENSCWKRETRVKAVMRKSGFGLSKVIGIELSVEALWPDELSEADVSRWAHTEVWEVLLVRDEKEQ